MEARCGLTFMRHVHPTQLLHRVRKDCRTLLTNGAQLWLASVAMAWALVVVPGLGAQEGKPNEYEVKAAYLYNFGRFVEWPAKVTTSKDNLFNICVLGQDPFGPALDTTLAGETISGKSVIAKRISSLEQSVDCQILFMSSSEGNRLNKIFGTLEKAGVLTVSDMPQFSQRGGMIQFVLEGKRVRFEVNLTACQNAGLSLSSELLKVATTVRRKPLPGD
jgi:hypothetical protein